MAVGAAFIYTLQCKYLHTKCKANTVVFHFVSRKVSQPDSDLSRSLLLISSFFPIKKLKLYSILRDVFSPLDRYVKRGSLITHQQQQPPR